MVIDNELIFVWIKVNYFFQITAKKSEK